MKHLREMLFMFFCVTAILVKAQDYLVVTSDGVNIRKAPNQQASILNKAYAGLTFVYLGTENGWHRFKYDNNQEAYISEKFGKKVTTDPIPAGLFQGDYVLNSLYKTDETRFSTSISCSRCTDGSLMLVTETMRMTQDGNPLPAESFTYKAVIKGNNIYTSSGYYGFGDCDSDEWKEHANADINDDPSKAAFWDNETNCLYFDNNVFEKQSE